MKGLTPFDRDAHESITVTIQGTHYSATRLWNVENDEITYYPLKKRDDHLPHHPARPPMSRRPQNLINTMKFNTRDKYAAFLDGNNGYSVIEGATARAAFW